jgi:hypothetical protein
MVKKAAAKKKSGKRLSKSPKKSQAKGLGPVDLVEVREKVMRLIADKAEAMTTANADEAAKGHLQQLRFLFEVLGLYPPTALPEEEPAEGNDLARVLLNRFEFPFRGPADEERAEAAGEGEVAAPAVVGDDSVE